MRMHGEPADLYFRQRKMRLRPLILILDVSGSMQGTKLELMKAAALTAVEHFASDDEDVCIEDTRYLFSFLPQNNLEMPPRVVTGDDPASIGNAHFAIAPFDTFACADRDITI